MRDLVPESQAYMDLLAFERKLDATITRKRLDIQEALKRPMKVSALLLHKIIHDNVNILKIGTPVVINILTVLKLNT